MIQRIEFDLTVADVMNRSPLRMRADVPTVQAARILAQRQARQAVVTNHHGAIIGVVSTSDVLNALADDRDSRSRRKHATLESLACTRFVSASPDVLLVDAVPLMTHGHGECLPVIERGRLQGVLAPEDLITCWPTLINSLQQMGTDDDSSLIVNRSTFERRLNEEWNRAQRKLASLGMVVINVDQYQHIVDCAGHQSAEAVMTMVGNCLIRQLRSYDVVARYGDDQFVAMCCECTPSNVAAPILRIQQAARRISVVGDGSPTGITLSIGAAAALDDIESLESDQLVDAAFDCVELARQKGGDLAFRTELSAADRSAPIAITETTARSTS